MTSFTRNWSDAYNGLPPNDEDARKGAGRIRDIKVDILERMRVDHRWHGDENDGAHQQVTMLPLASDPPAETDRGRLYVKRVGSDIELRYISEDGIITQLTSSSSPGNTYVIPGTIIMVGNALLVGNMVPAYIDCDGQAVGRTTYPGLFQAIGTFWGIGDGVNTFNVPDFRGRVPVAAGQGAGLTNRNPTGLFGTEKHGLAIGELPDHIHSIAVSTNPYVNPGVAGYQVTDVQTGLGGTGPNPALLGTPHNNMQPSVAVRFVIKT